MIDNSDKLSLHLFFYINFPIVERIVIANPRERNVMTISNRMNVQLTATSSFAIFVVYKVQIETPK